MTKTMTATDRSATADTPLHQRSKLKFAATKKGQEPKFKVLKPCVSERHTVGSVHTYASFVPNAPLGDGEYGDSRKAATIDDIITRLVSLKAIVEYVEPAPEDEDAVE